MELSLSIAALILVGLLYKEYRGTSPKRRLPNSHPANFPDIMGTPKPHRGILEPMRDSKGHRMHQAEYYTTLDIEFDDHEKVGVQMQQVEGESESMLDYALEEEDWKQDGMLRSEDGFAQGVTFEELSTVGRLLQKNALEPVQEETAVALVHKLQGTDLLDLLEHSLGDASRRIAVLLDQGMESDPASDPTSLRKDGSDGFDIQDFL